MAFASLDSLGYAAPTRIRTQLQWSAHFGHQLPPTVPSVRAWGTRRKDSTMQRKETVTTPGIGGFTKTGQPLRVHHASPSDPHCLALSGRLADVCAELERRLEAEDL